MESLIIHPQNEAQLNAFKAMAKAFNINFETTDDAYDPDFVQKIKLSKQEMLDGKLTRIEKEDLKALLGL